MQTSSPMLVPSDERSTPTPKASGAAWIRAALDRWIDGEGYRMASAQAYTLLVALVPLFVFLISVGHLLLGDSAAIRGALLRLVDGSDSPTVRAALLEVLDKAVRHAPSVTGLVVGLLGSLFSASSVFIELDAALNRLFGIEKKATSAASESAREWLRERVIGVLLVMGTSLVLLLAVLVGVVLSAVDRVLQGPAVLLSKALSAGATLGLLVLALTLCYRFIPDKDVPWGSAARGGLAAAVLFTLLRWPFGWIVVHITDYAAYGVVGAMLTVLFWFYLTSCVLLLGASLAASHQGAPPPLRLLPAPKASSPRVDDTAEHRADSSSAKE